LLVESILVPREGRDLQGEILFTLPSQLSIYFKMIYNRKDI